MLSQTLDKFKNSGRTFTSQEIVEKYERLQETLTNAWRSTPSADRDGREELYRQIKGIDAIMDKLISEWS